MLAVELTFLSPYAAVVAVPASGAIVAALIGRRRAGAVRRALRLPPPRSKRSRARVALVAAVVGLLAVSAAQPALSRDRHTRVRRDTQALFVFDVSRSMAASTRAQTETRLDRAVTSAERLRATIPDVSAGVATLTDRVLPDLLPVPGASAFDGVVERAIAIESPPPRASAVRATSYDALGQIPGGGYFDPRARSRVVVVLTDGETAPVQTGELAAAFAAHPGYHLIFIRFWRSGEAIYDANGRPEAAYRPDASGGAALESLAGALGASSYDEDALPAAGSRLQELIGTGPATQSPGVVTTETPLAPYAAGAALITAIGLIGLPLSTRARVRSSA